MTVHCHPDLQRLERSAAMDSPTSCTVLGHRTEAEPSELLQTLDGELYQRLYCGSAEPRFLQTEDPAEPLAFVSALSRANTGTGTWDPGWKISRDGRTATREGVTFWVERGQVRTESGAVAPGASCSVRIGKEMRHLLFGFYMALGNRHPKEGGQRPAALVRLYWHLTPDAAIRYMRIATERLNRAGLPFQTKVVSNPRQYVRRDSGVLYLRRADFGRAAPIVREIYQTVSAELLPEVPLFTKPLAPGLGLAEDPAGGMSFGQSRCRIAAQGVWRCHEQGLTEADARLHAIAEAFRSEGLDPAYPYLEAGSADCYAIDLA